LANFTSGGRLLVDSSFSSGIQANVSSGQITITSGLVQLLSGSAWIGVPEGVFNPASTSGFVASGQTGSFQLDKFGSVRANIQGRIRTYSAAGNISLGSGTNDFAILNGNSGIKATIVHYEIFYNWSTSGTFPLQFVVFSRTSADIGKGVTSGGTASLASSPHDPADPSAKCSVTYFTSGVTVGGLGGVLEQTYMSMTSVLSGNVALSQQLPSLRFKDISPNLKGYSLYSGNQGISFSANTTAPGAGLGASAFLGVTWLEEDLN